LFVVSGLLDGLDWPWDAKVDWLVRQTSVKSIDLRLGGTVISYPVSTTAARVAARTELVEVFSGLAGDKLPAALTALESATDMDLPSGPPVEYRPTSWDKLRVLESAGLTVAPHTVTHRIVSRLSSREVSWEVEESLRRVRAELAAPLAALAWPVGRERHLGTRELELARASDVRISFAAEGGYTDLRAARNDGRLRHKLGRFCWSDSVPIALRYATGLEAARDSLSIRTRPPRIPQWVMKFSSEDPSWRQRIGGTARGLIQGYRDATTKRRALRPVNSDADLEKVERLVFICKGNICRSPFAEAVARSRGWRSASYGLNVIKSQPADEIANKIALMLGIDITDHVARSIQDGDFSATDCLVAMDPEQYSALCATRELTGCKLALLGSWAGSPVLRVPDPYGKGPREMERVFRLIEDCVDGLLIYLRPQDRSAD
jgi:protein-tyrosine phosphatase